MQRARSNQDRHFRALVEDFGDLPDILDVRQRRDAGISHAGVRRAMNHRRVLVFEFLQVVGNDHAGDRPLGLRDSHRAIDAGAHLLGHDRSRHIFGYVGEQGLKVDLLLIARTESRTRLLTDDRDHRHMVHLRIVEPGQKVDGARTGCRVAESHLPGELRMRRRHERGHLLMANLDIIHEALRLFERDVQSADAIARIAVDTRQAPFVEALPDEFRDILRHEKFLRPSFHTRFWPAFRPNLGVWRAVRSGLKTLATWRIASPIVTIATAATTAAWWRSVNISQLRSRDWASKRPWAQ